MALSFQPASNPSRHLASSSTSGKISAERSWSNPPASRSWCTVGAPVYTSHRCCPACSSLSTRVMKALALVGVTWGVMSGYFFWYSVANWRYSSPWPTDTTSWPSLRAAATARSHSACQSALGRDTELGALELGRLLDPAAAADDPEALAAGGPCAVPLQAASNKASGARTPLRRMFRRLTA